MIPKFRVFAKAGTKEFFGGGYDTDQMFYEISEIDYYNKTVTVWGCHNKDCGMCDDTYKIEDVKIMMSTGLKDTNGVEIYEGDVVNVTQYFGGHSFGQLPHVVKASEYSNVLVLDALSKQNYVEEYTLYFSRIKDYEIIGNIYENPEWLEAHT